MAENSEKIEILGKNGERVEEPTMWERLFFIERFYRKNRKKLLFTGVVIILGGVAYIGDIMLKDYRADVVNRAYYNYQNGIEPEANLKIVEDLNPKLYSLIAFSQAVQESSVEKLEEFSKSSDDVISDLAQYQIYSINRDSEKLNEYSYRERAIYRDLAIISEAYTLINAGEMEKAQNRLSFIEDGSAVKEISNYLNHFGAVSKSYNASEDQFTRDDINSNANTPQ